MSSAGNRVGPVFSVLLSGSDFYLVPQILLRPPIGPSSTVQGTVCRHLGPGKPDDEGHLVRRAVLGRSDRTARKRYDSVGYLRWLHVVLRGKLTRRMRYHLRVDRSAARDTISGEGYVFGVGHSTGSQCLMPLSVVVYQSQM